MFDATKTDDFSPKPRGRVRVREFGLGAYAGRRTGRPTSSAREVRPSEGG